MSFEPDPPRDNDEAVLEKIFALLSSRVKADPSASDGSFAAQIRGLPVGLRAMAATHHLDVSLTVDDICWHFLNFGEPNLVSETEAGLRELGLVDLADVFHEAYELVHPHLAELRNAEEYIDFIQDKGLEDRVDELSLKARTFDEESGDRLFGSAIFTSWVRYARAFPERVFETGIRSSLG